MSIVRTLASAVALLIGMGVGTPTASAETLTGSGCGRMDGQVTVGTTVKFLFGPDCPQEAYQVAVGSATITYVGEPPSSRIWHQSVGRPSADAVCEEGWAPSWSHWMNDGTGGFTCNRAIEWAISPGTTDGVEITVLSPDAEVNSLQERPWVAGCSVPLLTPEEAGDTLIPGTPFGWLFFGNCPI